MVAERSVYLRRFMVT